MPEDEEEEKKEEEVVVEPDPEEEGQELIFKTTLAQNGQATIIKSVRERLNLEPQYTLYIKVLKVIDTKGKTIYESPECQ